MKAFITGAAGLIGSHLADRMLEEGYEVVGVDNLSIGKKNNLEKALKNKNFQFKQVDVLDYNKLKEAADDCEIIVHLAAFKIPIKEMKAEDTLLLNEKATENALNVAKEHNVQRFVFASTSDVYGKSKEMPFREDGNLVLGASTVKRWSYAASKIFDEHLCFAFQQSYGLPVTILRYFNAYGPRQDIGYVSGTPQGLFIDAIMKGKPITIHGTGKQTRAFTYISDTVEGTLKAIESKKGEGEIFNIGNDKTEISIKELAEMVIKAAKPKKKAEIKFVSHEEDLGKGYEDVDRRVPDISKARRLLNFEPKIGNEEGIKKTFEWQKQFYK